MTQVMRGSGSWRWPSTPSCRWRAAVLADWGADVIKIEHVERGDAMRGLDSTAGMSVGRRGVNVYMEHANRGKRSIGVDLTTPEGIDLVYRLAATCDVFLTNKLPAVRRKLKVDVDDIRAHNPNIVYVRGTGYGRAGRMSTGVATTSSPTGPARRQLGRSQGARDRPDMPGQFAPAMGDSIGGLTIAGGISAALLHRERTGEATVVDVSLLATGMWAISAAIALVAAGRRAVDGPHRPRRRPPRNPLVGNFRDR